ncbi:MAG: TetR/AcrR family transcriptional regulator [Candidatus Jettenia sp. CY-1]|nr:TetR/AcrR family transcriptional regulator [Candidatus Jettenia sp.]UJS17280.1 MAG: TetR/AcrR family transcriptional regulator [Candidatus Jettenia sp.]WKZ18450.1 MAG: TetR/AcrR family transcriptional regulator [Candidatus Jettenia sp. CY-1]
MKTKDRILKTGLKLFSKKGYLGATTKEIAKTAGIAEITLFRHFSSKERLFEEVINAYSFLPALKGLLPEIAELSYEEGLRIIAKRFLDSLIIRKDLIQIMHSEIHRYSEKIHRIYHSIIDEIFKTLASYFAEMQKKGVLKAFDTELGARAFLGMFFSYFDAENFLMLKKYRRTDTETIIKEFVMIFAEGTKK